MPRALRSKDLAALPASAPRLAQPLQHALCVVVMACAIKTPLDLPLYWNAGLLLLGFFTLMVVQSLQPIFGWMLVVVGLGTVQAFLWGDVAVSVPRIAQVLLLVMAASLVARLDPDLLLGYVTVLLPIIMLVTIVETFWPEPFFPAREVFGHQIHRQVGLHGEPNYTAMLYGVIAVLLAQRRPRALALVPLAAAVPTLSRGLLMALALWLTTLLFRRRRIGLCIGLVFLLCLQPALLLLLREVLDESTLHMLSRFSTERLGIWLAYVDMGLHQPLGAGYFLGHENMKAFVAYMLPNWPAMYAHSIFLQVFGEFGWLGYLAFVGFLLHVTARVAGAAPEQLPLLVFLLTGYAFVNGLSDWAFWVAVGYLLARSAGAHSEPPRP